MIDKIQKIDSSVVQHGKLNDRIYLMHLAESDIPRIAPKLVRLAEEQGYTKIFAKAPSNALQFFQEYDFFKEAYVPGFFRGKTGMYCLSKFLDDDRAELPLKERLEIRKIIELTKSRQKLADDIDPGQLQWRQLQESDATALTHLFKKVFKTYPFPIFDIDYIQQTMRDNVLYYGVFDNGMLIAAASAELHPKEKNAEMTDFAVHPQKRKKSLALLLLNAMEIDMQKLDIHVLYTIARALSPAINITFAKAGYYFGGTLKNNTNIDGQIESMNVWYKSL